MPILDARAAYVRTFEFRLLLSLHLFPSIFLSSLNSKKYLKEMKKRELCTVYFLGSTTGCLTFHSTQSNSWLMVLSWLANRLQKVPVDRYVDASAVRAFGPGLEPNNCRANIPQRFKIDATKSGRAPLGVDIRSEKGPLAQKPEVIDNGDGTYDVTYMPPPENSTCKVRVTYGDKDIPKRFVPFPFLFLVVNNR